MASESGTDLDFIVLMTTFSRSVLREARRTLPKPPIIVSGSVMSYTRFQSDPRCPAFFCFRCRRPAGGPTSTTGIPKRHWMSDGRNNGAAPRSPKYFAGLQIWAITRIPDFQIGPLSPGTTRPLPETCLIVCRLNEFGDQTVSNRNRRNHCGRSPWQ